MNKNFVKSFVTMKSYEITIRGTITTKLISFLPMVDFGHQDSKHGYGGVHSFIELGFIIFHLKIAWRKIFKQLTDDIYFDSFTSAIEVKDAICELIDTFGYASITDFYKLCGLSLEPFEEREFARYGWKSGKDKMTIKRDRYGEIYISMPIAKQIH